MSISISKYYPGNPSLAPYALIFDGNGDEIASTGDYIQGTGISLTGVDFTNNILDCNDIYVGDLVTAEVGYLDVYDSNDVKLIRFTFNPVLTLDHVEYTFLWPEFGVDFTVPYSASGGMNIGFGMYITNSCKYFSADRWFIDYTSASYDKTDTDIISIVIQRTFLGVASIQLHVKNAKVAGAVAGGEDYGIGKNFTGSGTWINAGYEHNYTIVSFGALDESKTVTLTVINNPVIELDRVAYIYLTAQSQGMVIGQKKTITIVDDNIPVTDTYRNIIDVTDPSKDWDSTDTARDLDSYTLVGDDATDNSTAIAGIYSWLETNGGGILYFPDGTYQMVSVQPTYPTKGISHVGESYGGVIVKRLDDGITRTCIAAEQVINLDNWSNASDCAPIAFSNMIMDGGSIPYGYTFVFSSTPANVPLNGESFVIDSTSANQPADTWTFVTGTPAANQIQIGATAALTATNLYNTLTAAGYTCHQATSLRILVYKDWTRYIFYTESVTNLSITNNAQNSTLFINGNPANTGKIVTKLEKIVVTNNPASEGIYIGSNSDTNAYYVDGGDEYFSRGFIDYTGGYSKARFNQITGYYFHCEYDDVGYDGDTPSKKWLVDVQIDNTTVEVGSFGVYGTSSPYSHTDSKLIVNNLLATTDWSWYGARGVTLTTPIAFTNCSLRKTYTAGAKTVSQASTANFTGCEFIGAGNLVANFSCAAIGIDWGANTGQTITFDDCDFTNDGMTSTNTLAVGMTADNSYDADANDNMIEVKNSRQTNAFTAMIGRAGTDSGYGGWYRLTDNTYYGSYVARPVGTTGKPYRLDIDGGTFINVTGFLQVYGQTVANFVNCQDVVLPSTKNVISMYSGTWATFCTNTTFGRVDGEAGIMRQITKAGDPSVSDKGMMKAGGTAYDQWKNDTDPENPTYFHVTAIGTNTTWTSGETP